MSDSANILIVDDIETNREGLGILITGLGHKPAYAENGVAALARIQEKIPDLILLDIMMPEMDGFELLEHIKERFSLRNIPVIMISALDDMESIVLCIKMGADDYLSKPFNRTLLKARISACLKRKQLSDLEEDYRQKIESYNRDLEERVNEKTRELTEAHQELAESYEHLKLLDNAKNNFLSLISHELRTPLNGLLGTAELLFSGSMDAVKNKEFQELFWQSFNRLSDIVKQALLLTEIQVSNDVFQLRPNSVHSALSHAIEAAEEFAGECRIQIGNVPACHAQVLSEMKLLTEALAALIRTAVRFSDKGETVNFSCRHEDNEFVIGIHATGDTVPEKIVPKFFKVFSVSDPISSTGNLGLEPPLAAQVIALFGGTVKVENHKPPGISLTVKLRLAES